MRYLGTLRGAGVLKSGDDTTGVPATYDFDGFLRKNDQVASCGEIRMTPAALKDVFGRRDLCLWTEDGRVLCLSFSEKKLGGAGDVAPVDVSGELPGPSDWSH
ncbi:MAG: hypothetical protein ACLP8A_18440 [Methylovirgula sp.]